ncbi:MAG: flagellar hook protein FlgE [Bacillota bacterium]
MLRSLFAGVTGSRSHQSRMDVIGNNIANVNTIGYKSARMTFQEAFAQTIRSGSRPSENIGGTNPAQIGLGNMIRSIDVDMTQGGLESTEKLTDMAIDGDGFFVLSDGEATKYTRDGSFTLDGEGYLVAPGSGYKVMGWMATDGKIDKSESLKAIRIQLGESMTAQATDMVRYRGNLNAESSGLFDLEALGIGAEVARMLHDAAKAAAETANNRSDVADGVKSSETSINTDISALLTAANNAASSSGATATHVVAAIRQDATVTDPDLRNAVADACDRVASAIPGATAQDVISALERIQNTVATVTARATEAAQEAAADDSATPADVRDAVGDVLDSTNVLLASAQAAPSEWSTQTEIYDSQGVKHELHLVFTKVDDNRWVWRAVSPGATGEGTVIFRADGTVDRDYMSQQVVVDPANGAALINATLDFSNITQFGAGSSVADAFVTGFPSGTLESFKIDPDGTITGIYSNQQNEILGQIVLAKFTNPAGLSRDGNNLYTETANSGTANIGSAAESGRGKIMSGQVEMSNVDLAREFTDMIITLRGFQANARLITTAEEMLQELIQLKR